MGYLSALKVLSQGLLLRGPKPRQSSLRTRTVMHVLLPYHIQCCASWVQSSFFRNKKYVNELVILTRAAAHLPRRRPHTLENKPWKIYLLILFLSHTQEILGRQSFLSSGAGRRGRVEFTALLQDSAPQERKCLGYLTESACLPHGLEKEKV